MVRFAFVFALTLAFPFSSAYGYDVELSAETIGQGYQLRSGDDTLVNRRRLTQYVGLNVYNLGPKDVTGRPLPNNQFYLSLSMRFEAELGDYADFDLMLSGRSPQREIFKNRLEVLYAFVGAQNLGGFVDL